MTESSASASVSSIVVLHKKLFTQTENPSQNIYRKVFGAGTRDTLSQLNNTNIVDKTAKVAPRNLFDRGPKRSRPVFPAALLNTSPNKTVANKTKDEAELKAPSKRLFGHFPDANKKNVFANFIMSESEDDTSEVHAKMFAFAQNKKPVRHSRSMSRGVREPSPTSSVTNADLDMDDWQMLPSSTMVEQQLEANMATSTPAKQIRTRLNKLSEIMNPVNTISTTVQETKHHEEVKAKKQDNNEANQDTKANNNSKAKDDLALEELEQATEQVDEEYVDNALEQNEAVKEIPHNSLNQSDKRTQLNKLSQGSVLVEEAHIKEMETEVQVHLKTRQEDITDASINNEAEGDVSLKSNDAENEKQSERQHIELENENEEVSDNEDQNDESKAMEVEQQEVEDEDHNENQEVEDEDQNESQVVDDEDPNENEHEQDENQVVEDEDQNDNEDEQNESQVVDDEDHYENEDEQNENEDEHNESQVIEDEEQNENEGNEDEQNESQEVEEEEQEQQVSQEIEEETLEQNESEIEEEEENQEFEDDQEQNVEDGEEEYEIENQEDEEIDISEEEQNESQGAEHGGGTDIELADVIDDTEEHDQKLVYEDDDIQNEEHPQMETENETLKQSPDTNGRHRNIEKKAESPEAVLHDVPNEMVSFTAKARNTSIRKTKSILKHCTLRPSLGFSDGTTSSSTERSEWDSHRTTRKTLRKTFGKDFTPRKSLRTLVMEKSAKRKTTLDAANAQLHPNHYNNLPTESDHEYVQVDEDRINYEDSDPEVEISNHDESRRLLQTKLEMYREQIKKHNRERILKIVSIKYSYKYYVVLQCY